MSTIGKSRVTGSVATITTAVLVLGLTSCASDSSASSGSESGSTQSSSQAAPTSTHTPSATESVGASITDINTKSGFYSADGASLTDPAVGSYKQVVLPAKWADGATYFVKGAPSTEAEVFDGVDKDAVMNLAGKAILNTLDGDRSYALTVDTDTDQYNADLARQIGNVQSGYVQGKFDSKLMEAMTTSSSSVLALREAVDSGDAAKVKSVMSQSDDNFYIDSAFAGPYLPLAGGYVPMALGADYNRIAVDSLDRVTVSRYQTKIEGDNLQPYLLEGSKAGDVLTSYNVRAEITYRIPVRKSDSDTVELSAPFKATVSAIILVGTDGTPSVYYSGSAQWSLYPDAKDVFGTTQNDKAEVTYNSIINPVG